MEPRKAAPARTETFTAPAKRAPVKKAPVKKAAPRPTVTDNDGVEHDKVLYIDASGNPVCDDACSHNEAAS